jgi:hypothetical protein
MWETALEIASRITHPGTIAVFVSVMAAFALLRALRAKKAGTVWVILAIGMIILGLAPLAASTFLKSRGIYRVRIVVLGLDQAPVDDAHVSSSIGGEPKRVESGWEFDIPPQIRPADGKVVLFASLKDAFLSGSSTLFLARDYYPTTTIQLISDTSAVVRGVVVDKHHRSVVGATVSIAGYQETVHTDSMGNFVLPAHAADGQIVQVRAQKDRLQGSVSVPAGKPVELVISGP